MKLSELHALVERAIGIGGARAADLRVVVVRSDPSVGPHACTDIKAAGPGIDWDSSTFQIWPAEGLHVRTDVEEIKRLRRELDKAMYELMMLRREKKSG